MSHSWGEAGWSPTCCSLALEGRRRAWCRLSVPGRGFAEGLELPSCPGSTNLGSAVGRGFGMALQRGTGVPPMLLVSLLQISSCTACKVPLHSIHPASQAGAGTSAGSHEFQPSEKAKQHCIHQLPGSPALPPGLGARADAPEVENKAQKARTASSRRRGSGWDVAAPSRGCLPAPGVRVRATAAPPGLALLRNTNLVAACETA